MDNADRFDYKTDSDAMDIRMQEQEKYHQMEVFSNYFLDTYTSAYYVSLEDSSCVVYRHDEEFERRFPIENDFFVTFREYIDTYVHPDDKEELRKLMSHSMLRYRLALERSFAVMLRDISDSNEKTYRLQIMRGADNNHVAFGFIDITEEINREKNQREQEARDKAVLVALSDDFGCVLYVDFDTSEEVLYRSDPLFEMNVSGWSVTNRFNLRIEKMAHSVVHPDDRKAFKAATRTEVIRSALALEKYYTVDFRVLINSNVMYYQCKFVRDEFSLNHFIAGFHNVDIETKREVAALEKAKKANRAKTDFLFNMSHDIRTPMNAIIGFTNMAIRDIDKKDKVLDSLKKVQSSSEMLLTIINDILDMSRIESGKVAINTTAADMQNCFTNIEPMMLELAKAKQIKVAFVVKNLVNRYAHVDIPRTERILVNLISNAIKYTLDGGWVTVTMTQLSDADDGYAIYRFVVADNGIGMSKEFVAKCFDEFAREENSTVSGVQGTGLGLSLAKALTELMSGNIYCESIQGQGSIFTIDIPFEVVKNPSQNDDVIECENDAKDSLTGKKVLLVEDNELNREIAADILREHGMLVTEAEDGRYAVEKVRVHGPEFFDVILMDIQMPYMSGYEAARRIRELFPKRHMKKLPIIAVSANAFEEDRKKSIEAGMDAHIAKPIDVNDLLQELNKFL